MPVLRYGVLKGRPLQRRLSTYADTHYHVQILAGAAQYRASINVQSQSNPSELEYLIRDPFDEPWTARLDQLPLGFTPLPRSRRDLTLDYVRGSFVDQAALRVLPFDLPGPQNDLNEAIDQYITRAIEQEDALIYIFGSRWGPEWRRRDDIFGFWPGNGLHDVHMNQGNAVRFASQDGIWQDGALFVQFPSSQRWVAIFLKFQSQCWQTDDRSGHCLNDLEMSPDERSTRHKSKLRRWHGSRRRR